jgi:hypothetical protein
MNDMTLTKLSAEQFKGLKGPETKDQVYLGCGDPFIGFCPYFLHENSSAGMSATLLLIAGTLIDLLILSFLQLHIISEYHNKKKWHIRLVL